MGPPHKVSVVRNAEHVAHSASTCLLPFPIFLPEFAGKGVADPGKAFPTAACRPRRFSLRKCRALRRGDLLALQGAPTNGRQS